MHGFFACLKKELELARLEHQSHKADKQREHELKMIQAQIKLERLRASNMAGHSIAAGALPTTSLPVPALSEPTPDWKIDPTLRTS